MLLLDKETQEPYYLELSNHHNLAPLLPHRAIEGGRFRIGGAGGDRTRDLLNAIQARSQLRHSPIYSFDPLC
jgi:hypothetical protein